MRTEHWETEGFFTNPPLAYLGVTSVSPATKKAAS